MQIQSQHINKQKNLEFFLCIQTSKCIASPYIKESKEVKSNKKGWIIKKKRFILKKQYVYLFSVRNNIANRNI